jgi:hypothetical protein
MGKYSTKVERPTLHPELGVINPGETREGDDLDKRFPALFRKQREAKPATTRKAARKATGPGD